MRMSKSTPKQLLDVFRACDIDSVSCELLEFFTSWEDIAVAAVVCRCIRLRLTSRKQAKRDPNKLLEQEIVRLGLTYKAFEEFCKHIMERGIELQDFLQVLRYNQRSLYTSETLKLKSGMFDVKGLINKPWHIVKDLTDWDRFCAIFNRKELSRIDLEMCGKDMTQRLLHTLLQHGLVVTCGCGRRYSPMVCRSAYE